MKASELFNLPDDWIFSEVLRRDYTPWEWLKIIERALEMLSDPLPIRDVSPGFSITGKVWLHPSVKLPSFGTIEGPAYIGEGCELRPGVYIRGKVIAWKNCILGNSCEFKNSILLDGVQCPHYNYVGDSVLGNKAHLGAGVILSNLRFDQEEIAVRTSEGRVSTGLRKLGCIMGDGSEIGCNAAIQPGSILEKRAVVGPCLPFGGTLEENQMIFFRPQQLQLPRRA